MVLEMRLVASLGDEDLKDPGEAWGGAGYVGVLPLSAHLRFIFFSISMLYFDKHSKILTSKVNNFN